MTHLKKQKRVFSLNYFIIFTLVILSSQLHADILSLVEDDYETPFLASIPDRGCSAVILSPQVIVSAGHCMTDFETKTCLSDSYKVELGLYINPYYASVNNVHYIPFEARATVEFCEHEYKYKYFFGLKVDARKSKDISVLITNNPIDIRSYPKLLPPTDLKKLKGTSVSSYGYPKGEEGQYKLRAKTTNGKVVSFNKGVLEINNTVSDRLQGISGGPTIVQEGKFKNYFAGINTGALKTNFNFYSMYTLENYKMLSAITSADFQGATREELIQILKKY